MPDAPVIINLPDQTQAPYYRHALLDMAEFAIHQDFGSSLTVAPREGAGSVHEYFNAHRICDASTALTDEIWAPLRANPPRQPPPGRREAMLAYADHLIADQPRDLTRRLRALRGQVAVLADEVPDLLQRVLPGIFAELPKASLWFVSVKDLLLSRLTLLRSQLALRLTPDIPLEPDRFPGIRLLSGHSLTGNTDFGNVCDAPLLAFSPQSVGFSMSWFPHALILLFGQPRQLEHRPEESFNELYRSRVLSRPGNWQDPAFSDGLSPADIEALVPWWVERLNILYSHAGDPTRFSDGFGAHDAAAQMAWLLTMERMLSDHTHLMADPNTADGVRMFVAFDLLDKAESLLGYSHSGPGFKELLRRSRTVERLNRAWASMPGELPRRFRRHTEVVFDSMYEDLRQHALQHRLTKRGTLVARDDPSKPRPMSMDDYASRLIRTVRNSAHGLSRQLRGDSGLLVATHDSEMPTQFVDVANLVVLGLVADADKLCAGAWW